MEVPEESLRYGRQLGLLPLVALRTPVTIIGAGAVGSFAALTLAKMGIGPLTVFDDDRVEPHNLPSQFFRLEDLGRLKVEALASIVSSFEAVAIDARPQRFEGGRLTGVVIAAVDSMSSRRLVWDAVVASPCATLLLDARMGGLVSRVAVARPMDSASARRYESTLHSDADALQEPCSSRSILFTVLGIASTLARLVRMELVGEELPREVVQDHALGIQLVS